MKWRDGLPWWGGGLLLALTLAALMAWWFATHTRIEYTLDLPPQGEAAYNPLYLLRETLRADDVIAQSRRRLQLDEVTLGRGDTVIFIGDPRLFSDEDSARLLAWVSRGGHLLLRLPPSRGPGAAVPGRGGALLERLGVQRVSELSWFCHELMMPGDLPALTLCAKTHFLLDGIAPETALQDAEEGFSFARLAWGSGMVDVWAQLDFLGNAQLSSPERAAFARQLLAPNYGHGVVHLVYGAQMPPLWQLLLEYGRMAWLPLLLALGAWLWLRMPRFGPLRPSPLPSRRALLEHIDASGEHLYRHGRSDVLHAALCTAFRERLRRSAPLAASVQGTAQHAAVAGCTGVAVAEVADALHGEGGTAADFKRRAATLVRMMRALGGVSTQDADPH